MLWHHHYPHLSPWVAHQSRISFSPSMSLCLGGAGGGLIRHSVMRCSLLNRFLSFQDGTSLSDGFFDVAANDDGSMVLAGYTWGSWNATNKGSADFVAVKLDSDGSIVWSWQVICCQEGRVSWCYSS